MVEQNVLEQVKTHWDHQFSKGGEYAAPQIGDPTVIPYARCLEYFGEMKGKTILDLGCGSGKSTLLFAALGAKVTAVDISQTAVDNLRDYIEKNKIENVQTVCCNVLKLKDAEPFDYIFGSMILHHIEPFEEFAKCLDSIVKPNGKCFFYENNSRSKFLMFFRKTLPGKLWIHKSSDDFEYPLEPGEIAVLSQYFTMTLEYPYLHYFRMFLPYIIPFMRFVNRFFVSFDNLIYKLVPPMRKYSYRQYLMFSKQ